MNKIKVKKVYLFFSAIFAFMLHLPFAFAGTKTISTKKIKNTVTPIEVVNNSTSASYKIYDSLKLNLCGLSENAFKYAIKGYEYLKSQGRINNDRVLSIVDFSKPSTQKRLFVLDLKNYKILFNTYVAHGQGSGAQMATKFSNVPESYTSSLGFYTTSTTYNGKNGFSMHLNGLEKGINDLALERAIVMHGADYVSETYINNTGKLGRSWGCPAVPEKLNKPIIEKIKNGTCLFIYSENSKYISKSKIINS